MRVATRIIGLTLLVLAQVVTAQNQRQNQTPELSIGDARLSAGGLVDFGYSGDYSNVVASDHGLTWGFDGKVNGYYYNPNFISFSVTPYYNQSRDNSTYQSLTGSSGVDGSANLFSGSHFPGSVNYHFDRNTSGTFGLTGQPGFTTIGTGQGFGVNWSALLPNMPTLTVGYSQGHGSGTIFGTSENTSSTNRLFNVHSSYEVLGFRLNAFFNRNQMSSKFPQFLAGQSESLQESTGNNVGIGAQHSLPLHGQFYANYDRTSADSIYSTDAGLTTNKSDYTDDIITTGASLRPTQKLTLNVSENYTSNLNGFLAQSLSSTGAPVPGVGLGSGAHSSTLGGGAIYQFTNFLSASSQATYYDQYFFGKSYTGTYMSGTVNYGKRLWDTFTFSASVIESNNGQGKNSMGFLGNVNFYHRFGEWRTSGVFTYAQNVQSLLVTYTTSSYNYSANVHRRLPAGLQWTGAFNGTHSGLTNIQGASSSGEGYSTSLSSRKYSVNANYTKSTGISVLGAGGLAPVSEIPGVVGFITFGGTSYGGGVSASPLRRMVLAGSFNRAITNTVGETTSHNSTEIYNAQLQYHLRRISLQAGYTRFSQGISAVGLPATSTQYFVGISRWFDFF